jgi:ferredoxin-type protein NapH
MEETKTVEPKQSPLNKFWLKIRGTKPRIFYWPIRTIVQLGFFLLTVVGVAFVRLEPSFNGFRSWVVLPVLASPYAQGTVTNALDATTVLLSQAIIPWLPVGIIFVVGAILGRFMCGWICPVGFLQDVITAVKGRVDSVTNRTHNYWIRLKYVLVGLAFILTGSLAASLYYYGTSTGAGVDYRSSLGDFSNGLFVAISPDRTMFGTLPVMFAQFWQFSSTAQFSDFTFSLFSSSLSSISILTWINILILVGFIYAAWRIPRFWCRYICPVGAIMAVTQKNSLLGMHRDPVKCSECKECETACPMQVPILDLDFKKFNDSECILCMACIDACPAGALSPKFP